MLSSRPLAHSENKLSFAGSKTPGRPLKAKGRSNVLQPLADKTPLPNRQIVFTDRTFASPSSQRKTRCIPKGTGKDKVLSYHDILSDAGFDQSTSRLRSKPAEEDDNELEYAPPHGPAIPFELDFPSPNYKLMGEALLHSASSYMVEDTGPLQAEGHLEANIESVWITPSDATVKLFDLAEDDPVGAALWNPSNAAVGAKRPIRGALTNVRQQTLRPRSAPHVRPSPPVSGPKRPWTSASVVVPNKSKPRAAAGRSAPPRALVDLTTNLLDDEDFYL